nr:sulfate transport system permease protein [Galdieria sulphuraria]AIG92612.1 sulfate transport system permease protein [Galdieria sulphuraria]
MIKYLILILSLTYLNFFIFLPLFTLLSDILASGILPLFRTYFDYNLFHAFSLTFSLICIVVPFNSLVGLWMAWTLTHQKFWGREILLFVLDIPLTLSPILIGLMMTLLYSKYSYLGSFLLNLGIKITYNSLGILLTTQFITFPLIPRQIIPILSKIDQQEEEAAKTLGANSWQIFWLVIFPYIKRSFLSGAVLTNARVIGEFGALLMISGNIIAKTQTLTLFLEQAYKEYQNYISNAVSLLLFLLSIFLLFFQRYLFL